MKCLQVREGQSLRSHHVDPVDVGRAIAAGPKEWFQLKPVPKGRRHRRARARDLAVAPPRHWSRPRIGLRITHSNNSNIQSWTRDLGWVHGQIPCWDKSHNRLRVSEVPVDLLSASAQVSVPDTLHGWRVPTGSDKW